jgi:hypothetical protein
MGERDDAIESFASELQDLHNNSKPLINMLTILAEENVTHAPQLASLIEEHLRKVNMCSFVILQSWNALAWQHSRKDRFTDPQYML